MTTQDSQSELDEIIETVATGVRHNQYMLDMQNRVPAAFNQLEFQVKREARQAIEAYVTTRVKEAERLARIDEWKGIKKHSATPPIRNHQGKGWWQVDWEYVKKRFEALTTTTNGKEEN